MQEGHDKLYRDSMRHLKHGYALYEPCPFTNLQPGMVGYLDEDRNWRQIVDLKDKGTVEASGYSRAPFQYYNPPDKQLWTQLQSQDVEKLDVDVGATASLHALGLPASVGAAHKYRTTKDFGAIVLCNRAIFKEGYNHLEPFQRWLKDNSKKLLEEYPNRTIIFATETYSTEDVQIGTWQGSSNEIVVGVNVGVPQASVDGATTYFRSHTSGHWRQFSDGMYVIFFRGIGIKYKLIKGLGVNVVKDKGWRGGNDNFVVSVDDKEFEAQVQRYDEKYKGILS